MPWNGARRSRAVNRSRRTPRPSASRTVNAGPRSSGRGWRRIHRPHRIRAGRTAHSTASVDRSLDVRRGEEAGGSSGSVRYPDPYPSSVRNTRSPRENLRVFWTLDGAAVDAGAAARLRRRVRAAALGLRRAERPCAEGGWAAVFVGVARRHGGRGGARGRAGRRRSRGSRGGAVALRRAGRRRPWGSRGGAVAVRRAGRRPSRRSCGGAPRPTS